MKTSLTFDSPVKVLNMDHCLKIFRHVFHPGNLKQLKQFHLSKAFSLPNAITGLPEDNENANSNNIDSRAEFAKYCPVDIDMDDMENDLNNIDAKIAKDEVPQPKRRGVYASQGITVYIPEKNMPLGTCKYRIDRLPPSEPDDIRVIKFGNP